METQKLYDYAKTNNITVLNVPLETTGAMCIADDGGNCYIGIDPWYMESEARERSCLIHELGHCATGSFYNRHTPATVRNKYEYKADKWAILRMIPRGALFSALQQGYRECWQLAEHFCVTQDFMTKALQYYNLL